ncbi:MAG: hypothetical protein QOD42_738 [Sphingomonadales bacterium]|jgi:hypothetical protein|nr:hypothetical protein [Sphingomonadales bacterium]
MSARARKRRAVTPVHPALLARAHAAPDFQPPLASLAGVPARPAVQRKCAQCAADGRDELPVQARLEVGPANDRYEREADAIADRVTRMSGPVAAPPGITMAGRPASLPRKAGSAQAGGGGDISAGLAAQGEGAPLAAGTRAFFEPRFGRDLGHVRVHDDAGAGRLARGIHAHAFTSGADIYFGEGRYDPGSAGGRHLLAHEITHTFQQAGGGPAPVQRATVKSGPLTIQVEYGTVINVPAAQLGDRVIAANAGYAGAAPDAAQESAIRGLARGPQEWLLFALKLLADNAAAAPGLDRVLAVARLVAQAPISFTVPLPDEDNLFVHEALEVSGWLESAAGGRLAAPGAKEAKAVDAVVNPKSPQAGDPLDVPQLERRLRPALEFLLTVLDPGKWKSTGTRSLSAFQSLGDLVQSEARIFFAPYADAAIGNIYSLRPAWKASANIFSTVAQTPTRAQRINHLLNRADLVGWADKATGIITDTDIYADTHFDPQRATDLAARQTILDAIEADPAFQPIIDRLVQHTGRKSGSGTTTKIGLVTEYNTASLGACEAHWSGIDTLCHEVLHALVHPKFVAASFKVKFPQVLREGFTEVLGVHLFNQHVAPKAKKDPKFKAILETGVPGAPCKEPTPATVDYGAAGAGAAKILQKVHPDNFRAAYFMGRTDLAGLP